MGGGKLMSHTIWGSFDGALTQYIRPYIEVSWTQNQAQNTSTVTASLIFHRYTNNYWSYNELTNSNGHSSTFRIGDSTLTEIRPFNLQRRDPPNWVTIWTRTRTIQHNSDGTASVYISASGDTNVNPRTYSFGETVTLPQIPRQTDITSVSMANQLKPSTANSLTVSLDRKLSSYTHRFEIMDGSTVLQSTTGNVPTSITVSAETVNKMIDGMSVTTSKDFTFRVTTLSGSTVIGWTTKDFTATLNADNTSPVISNVSVSIVGTGHDNAIGKYVQNISRVRISLKVASGRGADPNATHVQVAIGNQTVKATLSNGVYTAESRTLSRIGKTAITITAINSRMQPAFATREITVHEYTPPRIAVFSAIRSNDNVTNAIVYREHVFTTLGGDNVLTAKVERRLSTGTSWSEENTSTDSPLSATITGNNAARSYEYRTTITDSFGNSSTSNTSFGTARVLMEKFKDEGVSFGKRFETGKGTLQVAGDILHVTEDGVESNLTSPTLYPLSLQMGWTGNNVGAYKVGGIVFLTGVINRTSIPPVPSPIFSLPPGYRPARALSINLHSDEPGMIGINISPSYGSVSVFSIGSGTKVTRAILNGVSFPVGGD